MAAYTPEELAGLKEKFAALQSGNYTIDGKSPVSPIKSAAPTNYTPQGSTSAAQSASYVTSGQALKDSGKTSINGIINPNGSITDTTGMTPQQAYAADLKNRNPNEAAKYLSSMGLDINGNPAGGYSSYSGSSGNVGTSSPGAASPNAGAATVSGGNSSAADYINKLNEAKQQASIAALGKSRDAALSNLGQEKSAIQPKYYDQRNAVASGAQQQARNFAEYMANRGGSSAGSNAQATLVNNMSTQGNLGTLGRQEAQAYTDIGRRTTDVNNAYQSDIASTVAGGEAEKMQALLNDYYQQQQRDLQIAGLTGLYNDKLTLAGKQFEQGVNVDNRNFNYQTGRDNVLDSRYNQQFDYQAGRDQVADQRFNTQFDYQKARDSIGDERYKAEFDFNAQKYGQDYALQKAQLDGQLANNAADNYRQNASLGLQQQQFDWLKDPKNPANIYKSSQADLNQSKSSVSVKDSSDNYSVILEDISDSKVTKEKALQLLQANSANLNDSDYKKMSSYIEKYKY